MKERCQKQWEEERKGTERGDDDITAVSNRRKHVRGNVTALQKTAP